jgi:hypothetical protein
MGGASGDVRGKTKGENNNGKGNESEAAESRTEIQVSA